MLSEFIQRLFFREAVGVDGALQNKWVNKAERLGSLQKGFFYHEQRRLAYIHINPSGPLSGRCIILCHPISKRAKYFFADVKRAKHYLDSGDQLFAFDFNGFGESPSIDLYYWKDVVAAINHVVESIKPQKILLHGASFGAFHMLRALPQLPNGSEVVVENVNKSLISYWKRWPHTRWAVMCLQLFRVKSILQMEVESFVKSFSRDDLALRFIACEHDEYTTCQEMRELYAWFNTENKHYVEFAGAKHLSAPIVDPFLYRQIVLGH